MPIWLPLAPLQEAPSTKRVRTPPVVRKRSSAMITSLTGELIMKSPLFAELNCHGVGYGVLISLNTYGDLPDSGVCTLLTEYLVSVDVRSGASEHKLFGFSKAQERSLFKRLIGVQGVSSTIAMSMLGAMAAGDLIEAIIAGDLSALKGIKGIGPKLAQRIIGELAKPLSEMAGLEVSNINTPSGNTLKGEALSALTSLGLDRTKAERALQVVLKEHTGNDIRLEDLIRITLKNLN